MHLRALLDGAAIDRATLLSVPDDGDWEAVEVTDVACDSRAARRGSLFCCIRGRRADGHDHAPQAVAAGAVALVSEHRLRLGVPNVVVRSTADVAGCLAASLHGHPSRALRLLGATGTNGKTTTTYLLESILDAQARGGVGVIGTVETRWTGHAEASSLTTPDACELQSLLARMRDDGVTDVAMEVSSHALHQGRVLGCEFTAACFTNLSQDHLDYHGTMEEYAAAKRSLFTPRYTNLAVTNIGDEVGRVIAAEARALGLDVWTYAPLDPRSPAARAPRGSTPDVTAAHATFTLRSIQCTIAGARVAEPFAIEVPLVGAFNLENVLAAATTALAVGVPASVVASALRSAPPVPGRLQPVPNERGLHVFVDYAHTPEALTRVLAALRAVAPSSARLVVVYGAGGDRDRHKRPLMAMAVADGADTAVLTSDNPRSEDPAAIAAEVLRGAPGDRAPLVELDRRAAIALALREASPGDVVVIAGKGHEQGQTIGDAVLPFDDVAVARELLGALGGRS
ncbi:MAG TPA: UDP-N-acetylmuramoyl-L-alanyl-D-glutamate--2,6-diaminopimelate ligase [Acidimicrobiia bacterium]